jgi:hypothetical protein
MMADLDTNEPKSLPHDRQVEMDLDIGSKDTGVRMTFQTMRDQKDVGLHENSDFGRLGGDGFTRMPSGRRRDMSCRGEFRWS